MTIANVMEGGVLAFNHKNLWIIMVRYKKDQMHVLNLIIIYYNKIA